MVGIEVVARCYMIGRPVQYLIGFKVAREYTDLEVEVNRHTENERDTEDVATLKEVQIRIGKTRQKFLENKEPLRRNVGLNTKKRILACYVFSVFKHGPVLRRFKRRYGRSKCGATEDFSRSHGQNRRTALKNYTNGQCRRKIVATNYEAETMRGSSVPLLQLSLEMKIEGKRGQGRPRRN
ncbi:hypothetical protein ElyMa_001396600 [Elysia marginata]|uniref:Uncharacterized protein n=1 Tax=Elysia marginata TaxID=1093978 RepID=A0AAV4ISL7_9GAST|nr:hypothetical protein ElyMa_001396600 [Elysia marginata]